MPTQVKTLTTLVLYGRLAQARRRALERPPVDMRLIRQQSHWMRLLEESAAEYWRHRRQAAGREDGHDEA